MKKTLSLLLAGLVVALAGCAAAPSLHTASNSEVDYQKVDLVNRWAVRNNVEVHWVNYPMRYNTSTVVSQ